MGYFVKPGNNTYKMKTPYNILSECLDKMPNYFSSNEFSAICQKNGLSKEFCRSGALGYFLTRACNQGIE